MDAYAVDNHMTAPRLQSIWYPGALLGLLGCFVFAPQVYAASASAESDYLKALRSENAAKITSQIMQGQDPNQRMPGGKTPLMVAAKIADPALVGLLLERGAEVNATTQNGGTPLMFSAIRGSLETVEMLIEHGADVNAVAHFNWTAMMVAAAKGHDEVIGLLLEHGANADVADIYGWTPLMRAVHENRFAAVSLFLRSREVDLEAADDSGATALHHAARQGHVEIAQLLVDNGAELDAENVQGFTPLAMARQQHHPKMVHYLESRKTR
jgi:ankyrin repeat protein